MTTASAPLSTSSVNSMGSPIPQHGHIIYNNNSNSNTSYHSQPDSAPNSPTISNQQYGSQHEYHHRHHNNLHNSQYSQHHNTNSPSSPLGYTSMPPQGREHRRTSAPGGGLSLSYPRDHSDEPRMMSSQTQSHHHNGQYPPPTPGPYHSQSYSNQPGTRSSWAGHSTAEIESNFTLTSANKTGSSLSSATTTPTPATPYSRRSVHRYSHHDPQDDYHHSPQHGTYIPPSSSIGHQEYRAYNNSSNNTDESHHPYNSMSNSKQQPPYYHHKREGSYSSVDYHYQNSSSQDAYPADPYTNGGRGRGYDPGAAAAPPPPPPVNSTDNEEGGGKHRNNSVSSNASQSSSSSLSHYHSHLSGNKHPCKFPSCGWSFKRYEHLKRHMLVHSKERAFVCDYHGCEKSFSRSDNFSAHLRTHTKKSAAAAAAAAGTTTAHLQRFDRHQQQLAAPATGHGSMMIDPIRTNFPNSSTSALVSGPMSDVTDERRSGASGVGGGGADYSHHRHSIAGYPSYSEDSRSPSHMQNAYSLGPNQQPPKSATPGTSSSAFSFGFPSSGHQQQQHQQEEHHLQQHQQYHRRSPSSGMHPLDSPTTPTSATTPTSTFFTGHGPNAAAAAPGKPVDGMGGIVPKFNTIKLDLKSVTNHPEESRHLYRSQQYQQQQQQQPQQPQPRRFSSPGAHGNENEDVEIKGSRSARQGSPSPYPYHHYQQQQQQQQQHRYSSGSIHSGFKSEEHEDGDDVERERLTLRRRGSELDRKPLPVSTVTGHERPNPNPNGESPVLTPRGPVGALHVNEGDMEEEKDNGRGGKFGSSSMNFPASISSHFTPSSAGNNAKVTHSSRPGSPAMGRAVATDDVQNGGAEKDLNNSNNNGSSSKGDGHGLSTSSSTSSFVPVNKRPSLTTATTHSAGTNGVGSGRGGHEYASMSGSYQHLNGSVSPPRSNSDSYSGSVPMDEDGNPLHPQHRHTLPGYHHQTPQHHGGGYGDYDHMGGYPPSPRMHHHSSGSAPSSSFYPSGQQYSGPSSSSMNGYHNHPQFPAYHPQQYSMEDPASYHLHAHHPHGMPPMSATASSHLQQQPQPPQQQHQRSNNAVGGGRVRGMTSSAKNHCCPAMGCSKRFKRLEHLKRHTKTHTLERPFVCSTAGCNKRFSRSDNLSQHIKTHQRQLMNKIHWKQRSM